MSTLVVVPILVPLCAAIVGLLASGRPALQRVLSVAGAAAQLAVGAALLIAVHTRGIQVQQLGQWPAPFGITIVADLFSAMMVTVSGLVGLCVSLFALVDIGRDRERFAFHPLLHFLLMGVAGAFLAGDLFNLFVWFELIIMTSFVLLALGGERPQIEGAVKYLTMNFIASGLFLTALGILYGQFGTLNMADLAVRLESQPSGVGLSSAVLMLVAFGIKAGVFPLFFWLPDSYHTPPAAVTALFAGLLTKVGVYAMIRVLTVVYTAELPALAPLIVTGSLLTMVTGVLGAAAQYDIRRLLAFHIISQIGYMTLGLGLRTEAAMAAAVFYIVHNIVAKTNLFFVAGAIRHIRGTSDLKALGDLYRDEPRLAVLFLIPALALAGIPPLSGFVAKFALVKAALTAGAFLSAGVALAVGVLTLYSMTKIWAEAFWKPAPAGAGGGTRGPVPIAMLVPIALLTTLTVLLGVLPGTLLDLASGAATQLLDRDQYLDAVLGTVR